MRVAGIGAGYFAAFHYEAWNRIDAVQLVGAADTDLSKAKATGAPAFSSPQEMLAATRPDIIDIITPPSTHLQMIEMALSFRPKGIICQKPFCRDLKEAQQATRLAQEAGIPLVVHENFRFQPWYRAMKQALDAGAIGAPLQLSFRLRPGDGQGADAYLSRQPYFRDMTRFLVHETAVHWIDTFRFLLGSPARVFAELRQLNPAISGEDAGLILFDHGRGRRALFDGNRLLDHAAENTRCTMGEAMLEGETGTLALYGDGSVHLRGFGELTERQILPPSSYHGFGGDCVFHLQSHVVAALHGQGCFENLAEDYLSVLAIEDAVYRSSNEGRWIDL